MAFWFSTSFGSAFGRCPKTINHTAHNRRAPSIGDSKLPDPMLARERVRRSGLRIFVSTLYLLKTGRARSGSGAQGGTPAKSVISRRGNELICSSSASSFFIRAKRWNLLIPPLRHLLEQNRHSFRRLFSALIYFFSASCSRPPESFRRVPPRHGICCFAGVRSYASTVCRSMRDSLFASCTLFSPKNDSPIPALEVDDFRRVGLW